MAKADRTESKVASKGKSGKAQNGTAQTLAAAFKQTNTRPDDSNAEQTSSSTKQCDVPEKNSKQTQSVKAKVGSKVPQEQIQPASCVAEAVSKRIKRKTQSAGLEEATLSTTPGDDSTPRDAAAPRQLAPKQTMPTHQRSCREVEEVMAASSSAAAPKKKRLSAQGAAHVAGASGEPSQHEVAGSSGLGGGGSKQKSDTVDDESKGALPKKIMGPTRLGYRGAKQSGKKKKKESSAGTVGNPDAKQTQHPESCTGEDDNATLVQRTGKIGAGRAQHVEPKTSQGISKDEAQGLVSVGNAPKMRISSAVPLRRKSRKTRMISSPQKADQVLSSDTLAFAPQLAPCSEQGTDTAHADVSTKADRMEAATPPRRVPDSSSFKRLKRCTASSGEKRNKKKKLKSKPDEEVAHLVAATKCDEDQTKEALSVDIVGSLTSLGPEGPTDENEESAARGDGVNKSAPKVTFNWQAAFAKAALPQASKSSSPADPAALMDAGEQSALKSNEDGRLSQERSPEGVAVQIDRNEQPPQTAALVDAATRTEKDEREALKNDENQTPQKPALTLKAAFAKAAKPRTSMSSGPAGPAAPIDKDEQGTSKGNGDRSLQKTCPPDAAAAVDTDEQCALHNNERQSPQKLGLADVADPTDKGEMEVSKDDEDPTPRKTTFNLKAAFAKQAVRQVPASSASGCSTVPSEKDKQCISENKPDRPLSKRAPKRKGAAKGSEDQSTHQPSSDLQKDELCVLEDNEDPALNGKDEQDAGEDKEDQTPPKPAFNWSAAFAKASAPQGPTSTIQDLPTNLASIAAPLHTRREKTKADSGDSKKQVAAPVTWADRNLPTNWTKQLRPRPVWAELWDWLKAWQPPSQSMGKSKSERGAVVSGPSGVGKTTGVRLMARKLREHVVEYDMIDAEGRSFMENLAKKQRNGNQLDGKTVVVCNVAEQLTQAHKDMLQLAVQSSVIPVIIVAADGVLTAKDALMDHCLEVKLKLKEPHVAKVLQDVVKKEGATLGESTCQQIAAAFPSDLRQAILTAQLLSAAPGGEDAHLPREAMALPAACRQLLCPGQHDDPDSPSVDETLRLLSLDESVPELLRWNCMRALSFYLRDAFETQACSSEQALASHTEPRSLSGELQKLDEPSEEMQTLAESSEELQKLEEPSEELQKLKEPSEEMQKLAEPPKEPQKFGEPSEEAQKLAEPSEKLQKLAEPSVELQKLAEPSEKLQKLEEPSEESPTPRELSEEMQQHGEPSEELQKLGETSKDSPKIEELSKQSLERGKSSEELQKLGEPSEELQQPGEPSEEVQRLGEPSEEMQEAGETCGEATPEEETYQPPPPRPEELEALDACSKIAEAVVWSDVAVGMAEAAAIRDGTMVDRVLSPAAAEPLLLAVVSSTALRYARDLGVSRTGTNEESALHKFPFQPQTPACDSCPLPQDQLVSVCKQLGFPKAWALRQVPEFLQCHRLATTRKPKDFKNWLRRRIQARPLPLQRETSREVATEKDADSACQEAPGEVAAEKVADAGNMEDALGAEASSLDADIQLSDAKPCSQEAGLV